MANTTLNMQLLLRRDQVFTSTYVLAAGEPGFEISTNTFKVGDGTKTWAELPIANKAQIDALIKVTDDKLAGYKPLQDVIAAVETSANTFVDTVAQDANGKITITTKAVDFSAADDRFKKIQTAVAAVATAKNVFVEQIAQDAQGVITITTKAVDFSDYRTSADQDVIDNGIKVRLDTLEAKPFDTYATKTEVQEVAGDLSDYETSNDARVKAIEDEIDGFNYADATETTNALNDRYTKAEADAEFTTPAEVIAEVNKALSEVSNADTIESITTLVNYVNENAADLTGLITEVYGSAEMTGDSRLDTIEAKAAMGITADDITAWNAEKGVKAIVDANKATWDKAGTALQAADLADYAKTADVVTNEEFTAFEDTNNEAIGKKLDKTDFDAFNNGTSKTVAAIEADIVAKANAAQAAAEAKAAELDTALHTVITGEVATAKQEAINAAKEYANGLDHEDTTYTVAATENALEFTVTPDGKGEAQTVKLVAPTVDTGIMSLEAGEDIVVTPGENGKVTVAHETFTTGEYTKDPATSDKTGDVYMMTGVTVDNGHVTGAAVKSLAAALEGMTFIFDGGTSSN